VELGHSDPHANVKGQVSPSASGNPPRISCKLFGKVVMLLVRLVRSNRKMKARLGKVIFNVTVWVAVIVSLCSGLQKLPGKEPGVAKAKVQSFIQLVFATRSSSLPMWRLAPGRAGTEIAPLLA